MIRRLAIAIVAIVALSGAAVADRLSPPPAHLPARDPAAAPGGVWACPVVKQAGTGGWLHLVNAGADASQIRITFVPDRAKRVEQSLTLKPGRATTIAAPASIGKYAAGAIVEYAGGDVVVSRSVLLFSGASPGAGAASCSRPEAATVLVVPQGLTLRGDTQIVLLNPGSADALVDMALIVDGDRLEPESLQRRIVPAGGRLVVREGDFAFDEPVVAGVIRLRSGRVVADGVVVTPGFVDIVPAEATTRELAVVASTARGGALFGAVSVSDEDAITRGSFLSTGGQTTFEPLTAGLPPDTPKFAAPPGTDIPRGAVALVVRSSTGPIAITSRWQVVIRTGAAETAVASGVKPAHRAVAVLGAPAQASTMRLLVANPDATDALIDVTLFSPSAATAPAALQRIRVAAGSASTITFPAPQPVGTLGVALTARGGRVAAALEGVSAVPGLFAAFAVTASPVATVVPVAVEPDPRQGVPA
jgi:Family of unknown function (DUF5719)